MPFLGQPGCGKTHWPWPWPQGGGGRLPGLLHHRRRDGDRLPAARRDGSFTTKLRTYTAPCVLVIDDVGLLPMEAAGHRLLPRGQHRRRAGPPVPGHHNRGLPAWGDVFGDAVATRAILDRLMHRAVVFDIRGPSWRMREHAARAEAAKT